MIRRLLCSAITLLFALTALCIPAAAEEPISAIYVPRTQRGTLFYLDIAGGTDIAAAVCELRYDPAIAEYRSVYCDDDNASAMGNAENGVVKIAYSNKSSAKGKLFRVAFKALKAGSLKFVLSVTQAVDGDLKYITDIPSYTLDVTLGSSDVSSSGSESSKSNSSKKTYKGEKSDVSASGGEDAEDAPQEREDGRISRDYSGSDNAVWFWLGGAVALLICLLVIGCFLLIKRIKAHKNTPPELPEPLPDRDDEDVALFDEYEEGRLNKATPEPPKNNPDLPLPDVFKDIE